MSVIIDGDRGLVVPSTSWMTPLGRLTLTTSVPVLISTVSASTSIYYTPYIGNAIPIYDGTNMLLYTFTELTNTTTNTTVNPAAVANNSNYDMFVWNNSGTITLSRGPAWISDTARGTGAGTTELQRINGILTNKISITNGPTANKGTYVGTVRSNGSATVDWILGGVSVGGTAAVLGVWNCSNRVDIRGFIGDSTDNWTYSTTTTRPANNSTTNRVSFIQGLQEDYFDAEYLAILQNGANSSGGWCGIGYDVTNAFSGRYPIVTNPVSAVSGIIPMIGKHSVQALGFHFMQACESSIASGTTSWFGDNGGNLQTGTSYYGRF